MVEAGKAVLLLVVFVSFLWALFAVLRKKVRSGLAVSLVIIFALTVVLQYVIFQTAEDTATAVISNIVLVLASIAAITIACAIPAFMARMIYGEEEFLFLGSFPLARGLDLPEGTVCTVIALCSCIVIEALEEEHSLPVHKLISVSVQAGSRIQQQCGATAGGGASLRPNKQYLIFAYQDGEEIKYIVFDATGKGSLANRFKRRYKERRQMETVKIDL